MHECRRLGCRVVELAPETEVHGGHFSELLLLNLTLTSWHLAARCSPPPLVSEFAAGVHHLTSHELVHRFLFFAVVVRWAEWGAQAAREFERPVRSKFGGLATSRRKNEGREVAGHWRPHSKSPPSAVDASLPKPAEANVFKEVLPGRASEGTKPSAWG
jgi:hypothetical protein